MRRRDPRAERASGGARRCMGRLARSSRTPGPLSRRAERDSQHAPHAASRTPVADQSSSVEPICSPMHPARVPRRRSGPVEPRPDESRLRVTLYVIHSNSEKPYCTAPAKFGPPTEGRPHRPITPSQAQTFRGIWPARSADRAAQLSPVRARRVLDRRRSAVWRRPSKFGIRRYVSRRP